MGANQSTNRIVRLPYVLSVGTYSTQLDHPWAQMFTLLDRSSVIFKFPSLRFNFYQGHPQGAGLGRRGNLSRQIFSFVVFFPPSMALTSPLCTNFFIIKTRSGVGELGVANSLVITKHNRTAP